MTAYTFLPKDQFIQIRENIYYYTKGPKIEDIITQPIYRYMSELYPLLTGNIHLSQRIDFSDAYEHGVDRNPFAHQLTCVGVEVTQQDEDRFRMIERERLSTLNWSTICFAFDAEDDYFFWNCYTSENFGIRYQTTLQKLIDSIVLPDNYEMFIGVIDYKRDCPSQKISDYAFHKFEGYKRETELRIYFLPKEKNLEPLKDLHFNAEKMIDSIKLSPFLSSSQKKNIYGFINEKYPFFKQKTMGSEIKLETLTKQTHKTRFAKIKMKALLKAVSFCFIISAIMYFAMTYENRDPARQVIYNNNGTVDLNSVKEYFYQNKDKLYPIEGMYTVLKQYIGPARDSVPSTIETHYIFRSTSKEGNSFRFNDYREIFDSLNFIHTLVPSICNYYNWSGKEDDYSISISEPQLRVFQRDQIEYTIDPTEFQIDGFGFSYIIWISGSDENYMAIPHKYTYMKLNSSH